MDNFRGVTAGICLLAVLSGCAVQKKMENLRRGSVSAQLALPPDRRIDFKDLSLPGVSRDTIVVTDVQGNEMILMKAVRDEDSGEMVASETLDAAYVTAKFKNVAERHGKVDIEFQVIVPEALQDGKWQARFFPKMYVLGDTLSLDRILVTGNEYRRQQLRGYEQYNRFLATIVNDTTLFINSRQLELFIERNMPQLYSYKTDSTFVPDEVFLSAYGVSEKDAVDHYMNRLRLERNNRRKSRMNEVFLKRVKSPIVTDGLKLDTVVRNVNGDFVYNYVQEVVTKPKLKSLDILMEGEVYEQDKRIYTIPETEPLTFYISSISAFADGTEKYLTKVVERQVSANADFYISFETGQSEVKEDFSDNAPVIRRIRDGLAEIVRNTEYDLDSIVVTASASPEGSYHSNKMLSQRRSEKVSEFFQGYVTHYADSLIRDDGAVISMDEDYGLQHSARNRRIKFISHCNPENWTMLDRLVESDDSLSPKEKEMYVMSHSIDDPDNRESFLKQQDFYQYLFKNVYPRLRTVNFDIRMHRKGMVKDTVHTTVLDTQYMEGVQAIRDRDYSKALNLLKSYGDYNTAVAYCAMDYNRSAYEILESLPASPRVNYLMAIIHSRFGEDQDAVQCYLNACSEDPSYVHRGNLDPEISSLIKKYALNNRIENY